MIKKLEKKRAFSIAFLIIIALEIFLVSSIPGGAIVSGFDFSNFYHFIAFFLLNFFFLISVNGKSKKMDKTFILILIISLVYAILDEMHQFFVPLRTPDIMDFLVDSIGIFSSSLVYLGYYIKKR